MSDPVWYRSLYWRIGFGFVALLAVLLLMQSLLFLWLTDRFVGSSTARTPAELAKQVAGEVGAELEQHPDHALEEFVQSRYSHVFQPFLVMLSDGQRASNRPAGLPFEFGRLVRSRMRGENGQPHYRRRGGGGPRFPTEFAPILAHGSEVGLVGVPANPPPVGVALRELGPTLSWFGLGLLAVGATLTALLIFRPAHKRLRTLEQAARALGEGRADVRATETGGDEVSSLARTFNRMAIDLDSRAAALTQSDRARRQLLADVSHELMTPLSAIRGYVETLGMVDVPLDQETRRRYLGIVEHETHELEAIIGDLLDLARLEGGGDKLRSEPVSVCELFKRVSDRHLPAIRDRRITLDFDIGKDTPNVRGDAARLEQALQNLAANAIRHTPSDGRVRFESRPADAGVQIVVRDTGPGIPTEHLPRVFDRFYKVDAARTGTAVPSGSGLGLSIVRAIVARHGGTVSVANAPEGGAVFELWLPRSTALPPAPAPDRPGDPGSHE
jgi:signal transduction histidine kinase